MGHRPDPSTGRRRRRKRVADTRAEARAKLKALQAELEDHGERLAERDLTLAAFMEQTWLPRLDARVARGEIRPQTADMYRQRATDWIIPTIGRVKLRELRPRHVDLVLDAITKAGRKPATANRCKAVLSIALGDARRAGLPVTNVAADVRALPERRDEPVVATPEQARRLLDLVAGEQFGIAVVLMAVLGLQVGEALGLAWSDVDLDGPTLRIRRQARRYGGKMTFPDVKSTASRRTIVLPEVAVAALLAHRARQSAARATAPMWTDPEPGPLVVSSNVGTAVEVGNLRRWWVNVRERAGLPGMRLHDLRHSAATFALAAGASVREVADLLGHADGGALVLSRYGHVLDERRRANAERLNSVFTQADGPGARGPVCALIQSSRADSGIRMAEPRRMTGNSSLWIIPYTVDSAHDSRSATSPTRRPRWELEVCSTSCAAREVASSSSASNCSSLRTTTRAGVAHRDHRGPIKGVGIKGVPSRHLRSLTCCSGRARTP